MADKPFAQYGRPVVAGEAFTSLMARSTARKPQDAFRTSTDATTRGVLLVARGAQVTRSQVLTMVKREVDARVGAALKDLKREIRERLQAMSVPVTVELADLACDEYRLLRPVKVVIERFTDEVTASWPEVEAFGSGVTESLAIAALRRDIVDIYRDLADTPDAGLGRAASAIKRILRGVVAEDGRGT